MKKNRISIKDEEYDINPNIQAYFTITKLTTKPTNDEEKSSVYEILKNIGFYSMRQKKWLKSARMQNALHNLPKEIAKFQTPTLPALENVSDDLQGEGVKFIIPSNVNYFYTRLEILLGLKLSGHTKFLTEASNLIDELYKRNEIESEQRNQKALNIFQPFRWKYLVKF